MALPYGGGYGGYSGWDRYGRSGFALANIDRAYGGKFGTTAALAASFSFLAAAASAASFSSSASLVDFAVSFLASCRVHSKNQCERNSDNVRTLQFYFFDPNLIFQDSATIGTVAITSAAIRTHSTEVRHLSVILFPCFFSFPVSLYFVEPVRAWL